MHQLAVLLSASPAADTFGQLRRACDGMLPGCQKLVHDHRNDAMMTSKVPSVINSAATHHDVSSSSLEHSSFSIDNILSSPPQRRGHGDERQHEQPDRHYHRHQISAESLRTYHNTSLPVLPLTHAFYGQCPVIQNC